MFVSRETGEAAKLRQRESAVLDNMFAICPSRHLSHRVRPTDHWRVPRLVLWVVLELSRGQCGTVPRATGDQCESGKTEKSRRANGSNTH